MREIIKKMENGTFSFLCQKSLAAASSRSSCLPGGILCTLLKAGSWLMQVSASHRPRAGTPAKLFLISLIPGTLCLRVGWVFPTNPPASTVLENMSIPTLHLTVTLFPDFMVPVTVLFVQFCNIWETEGTSRKQDCAFCHMWPCCSRLVLNLV